MPRSAALASRRSYWVSTMKTSTPPSARPRACSANASTNSASMQGPWGLRNFPVGPTLPATNPPAGAVSRARTAAAKLISRVRDSSPWAASLIGDAPKLLVETTSAPAAK
jgi:hypothetical protein